MAVIDQYNFISNKVDKITNNSSIKKPEIVVITKKINYSDIIPLINLGHIHYGESKVQEAIDKWKLNLVNNSNIKLHMIGRIQSNKVDQVCGFFDYIHSLDSIKLANAIYKFEEKNKKKVKIFVQVNIGDEAQKGGITISETKKFVDFCLKELKLNIIGLMCIPPANQNSQPFFNKLKHLANECGVKELSMGMSNDYEEALKAGSTYLRIGSAIFGNRN
jgi:pyridoxal phosphate enzyme (YggS family)